MDNVEVFKRFYPSTESFLVGEVNEDDLYDYIFHGFALVNINNKNKYVSCSFNKPLIAVEQTPEIKEIFRKKHEGSNNNSGLIKLFAKLKYIQVHYGNNEKSWDMIKKELAKEEFSETIKNFKVTIDNMIGHMFSGYIC